MPISGFRYIGLLFVAVLLGCCNRPADRITQLKQAHEYLNLNDSVKYVGMNACKECHYLIYKSYLRTGMGLSFDTASPRKSAAVIGKDSVLYDPDLNIYIKPFWSGDSLMVKEYREQNGELVHERIELINYIVGSGQHTNSHIFLSGNYAYQIPFTYYTQDSLFDVPPGFEDGHNSRFSRSIGLECMSCHNGFPTMVMGSENKFTHIPDGIDCERCHGPGEIHVMLKKSGFIIDTSRYTDYSIVNPANLPMNLQTDLCARCHLQGTMVLQPAKSYFDFKPGMELKEVMDIFMPLFEGGKEDFIMASHYERMVQSTCYTDSNEGFTCISCHDPHVSKKETPPDQYNKVCISCHESQLMGCESDAQERHEDYKNCVRCHMREGATRDIPHVKTHDHKISRPPTETDLNSERIFKGLISVNNPETSALTHARGYLLEFESYHPDPAYLDSAWYYLQRSNEPAHPFYFNALINYFFLKQDNLAISEAVEQIGYSTVLDSLLIQQEYSNYDAWTAYRIGQAYENSGNAVIAGYFYKKAVDLAPFHLDFLNKYGSILVLKGELKEAAEIFGFVLDEDPRQAMACVNLGYLYIKQSRIEKGEELYQRALSLDPDHEQALLNLAALYLSRGEILQANSYLDRVLDVDPENSMARELKKTAVLKE